MTTLASVDSVLMIADIARTLNDFRPLQETLDHICLRVSGVSGYEATAILLPGEAGDSLLIRGSWGMSTEYLEHVNRDHPLRLETATEHGLSPTAEAYRSGHPVALADVELEPSFQPWRRGARLQRYRSLVCVPVILRSRVIGVLNCYGRTPHRHTPAELELLQLVARLAGAAIETARVAEGQRQAASELRDLSERLREQNRELSILSAVQSRLTQHLNVPDATAVERTAQTLAEITDRSVLIAGRAGDAITFAGRRGARLEMARTAARRDVAELLSRRQLVSVDRHSCVRVGLPEMMLGTIVLSPALADERGIPALAAIQAAAVVAAELQGERADRALDRHARPAVMLAMAHGLYGRAQLSEVAGVLGVPAETEVRLAVLRCPTPEAAHRLCRRLDHLRAAGWPVITASPSGRDALVLLAAAPVDQLRQAAVRIRERRPEVERIGVSAVAAGLGSLAAAREQALTAGAVDVQQSATMFEDLGPFGGLAGELPPGSPERLVQNVLGRVLAHDQARKTRLVETLAAYVRHSGRVQEAARELGIHPNTLHQRLRRAADLGGFQLRDYRTLGSLVLALEWERMLRARAVMEEREEQ